MAAKIAELSEERQRHGAVIVRGGSVISVGINRHRNHPMVFDTSYLMGTSSSTHAEFAALRKALNTPLQGGTIYVARINKAGRRVLSRPCDRCHSEILRAGIKQIVYTI